MTDRFPDFTNPVIDADGNVISGARYFFYREGTSTKKDTYSNSAKTTPNANPVVADSGGRFGDIFMLIDEQYKVVLAPAGVDDPPSSPIDTWDNLGPVLDNPTAQIPVVSTSGTYNVAVNDRGKLIECDASGGAFSVNLLAAATAANGFTIRVKKVDSSANAVTVDGNLAETIDGATTYALNAQYDFVDIVTDGTEWHIVGTSATPPSIITLGTEQATTSGTEVDFTSLPAGLKRITVMFSFVSTSGTSQMIIQLGDSGGFETSGYSGAISGGAASFEADRHGAGFLLTVTQVAASSYTGEIILARKNDTFSWTEHGGVVSATNAPGTAYTTSGIKTLSAELTQIRLTTEGGTDTFDGGSINISYE